MDTLGTRLPPGIVIVIILMMVLDAGFAGGLSLRADAHLTAEFSVRCLQLRF